MKIWIDLSNSPHVLFFRPLVRVFRARGHEVTFTARDFAQTLPLARKFGLEVTAIGRHGGANRVVKVFNILNRAVELKNFALRNRPDLAVSHNSYAHALAAWRLGLPSATLMDYEFQPANHISFRLADRVIVPRVFPEEALRRFHAAPERTFRFDGLKEEIYLSEFEPAPGGGEIVIEPCEPRIGAPAERVSIHLDREPRTVVVLRPPPTMAAYHRFDNPLFPRVLDRIAQCKHVMAILLPRTEAQADDYRSMSPERVFLPLDALDGPELMLRADLVISAGGTMNREAAVLGTPAATIFRGEIGAVDRWLIEQGKVKALESDVEVDALEFRKKTPGQRMRQPALVEQVADLILATKRG